MTYIEHFGSYTLTKELDHLTQLNKEGARKLYEQKQLLKKIDSDENKNFIKSILSINEQLSNSCSSAYHCLSHLETYKTSLAYEELPIWYVLFLERREKTKETLADLLQDPCKAKEFASELKPELLEKVLKDNAKSDLKFLVPLIMKQKNKNPNWEELIFEYMYFFRSNEAKVNQQSAEHYIEAFKKFSQAFHDQKRVQFLTTWLSSQLHQSVLSETIPFALEEVAKMTDSISQYDRQIFFHKLIRYTPRLASQWFTKLKINDEELGFALLKNVVFWRKICPKSVERQKFNSDGNCHFRLYWDTVSEKRSFVSVKEDLPFLENWIENEQPLPWLKELINFLKSKDPERLKKIGEYFSFSEEEKNLAELFGNPSKKRERKPRIVVSKNLKYTSPEADRAKYAAKFQDIYSLPKQKTDIDESSLLYLIHELKNKPHLFPLLEEFLKNNIENVDAELAENLVSILFSQGQAALNLLEWNEDVHPELIKYLKSEEKIKAIIWDIAQAYCKYYPKDEFMNSFIKALPQTASLQSWIAKNITRIFIANPRETFNSLNLISQKERRKAFIKCYSQIINKIALHGFWNTHDDTLKMLTIFRDVDNESTMYIEDSGVVNKQKAFPYLQPATQRVAKKGPKTPLQLWLNPSPSAADLLTQIQKNPQLKCIAFTFKDLALSQLVFAEKDYEEKLEKWIEKSSFSYTKELYNHYQSFKLPDSERMIPGIFQAYQVLEMHDQEIAKILRDSSLVPIMIKRDLLSPKSPSYAVAFMKILLNKNITEKASWLYQAILKKHDHLSSNQKALIFFLCTYKLQHQKETAKNTSDFIPFHLDKLISQLLSESSDLAHSSSTAAHFINMVQELEKWPAIQDKIKMHPQDMRSSACSGMVLNTLYEICQKYGKEEKEWKIGPPLTTLSHTYKLWKSNSSKELLSSFTYSYYKDYLTKALNGFPKSISDTDTAFAKTVPSTLLHSSPNSYKSSSWREELTQDLPEEPTLSLLNKELDGVLDLELIRKWECKDRVVSLETFTEDKNLQQHYIHDTKDPYQILFGLCDNHRHQSSTAPEAGRLGLLRRIAIKNGIEKDSDPLAFADLYFAWDEKRPVLFLDNVQGDFLNKDLTGILMQYAADFAKNLKLPVFRKFKNSEKYINKKLNIKPKVNENTKELSLASLIIQIES